MVFSFGNLLTTGRGELIMSSQPALRQKGFGQAIKYGRVGEKN